MNSTKRTLGQLLMGAAFANITGDTSEAAVFDETTDFSNDLGNPTSIGLFDPVNDKLVGTIADSFDQDYVLFDGTPTMSLSIPVEFNYGPGGIGNFQISATDHPGGASLDNIFFSSPGSGTLDITVPADGDYKLSITVEGSGQFNYTIGNPAAVPEPGTWALLAASVAVAGLANRFKKSP